MEIAECVPANETGYIETAVRLGTDPAFNQHLRRMILERNHVLYENVAVLREFERYLRTAVQT
jgi:predicted O-linked N-acetylglucosamine transferase (SPINDLY family)